MDSRRAQLRQRMIALLPAVIILWIEIEGRGLLSRNRERVVTKADGPLRAVRRSGASRITLTVYFNHKRVLCAREEAGTGCFTLEFFQAGWWADLFLPSITCPGWPYAFPIKHYVPYGPDLYDDLQALYQHWQRLADPQPVWRMRPGKWIPMLDFEEGRKRKKGRIFYLAPKEPWSYQGTLKGRRKK